MQSFYSEVNVKGYVSKHLVIYEVIDENLYASPFINEYLVPPKKINSVSFIAVAIVNVRSKS